MNIAELQEHVSKLDRLLKHPEPELFTWYEMVRQTMEEMIRRWNEVETKKEPK